jgi:hypothetical protein
VLAPTDENHYSSLVPLLACAYKNNGVLVKDRIALQMYPYFAMTAQELRMRFIAYVLIEVWPGWIEGPMEFTQTAAWLRRDYTEQVLDWSRDKARLAIQIR